MENTKKSNSNQVEKKLVNFRLDAREIERLRNRAEAHERTVSGEIRKLIRDALDKGTVARGSR